MYNNYKKQDYNTPYSMLQTFQSCYKYGFHSTQLVYLGFAKNELSHKDNLLYLAPKWSQSVNSSCYCLGAGSLYIVYKNSKSFFQLHYWVQNRSLYSVNTA